MTNAILLDARDNVATCTDIAHQGDTIKIIGEAATDIAKGSWVSHENIFSVPRDYAVEFI